MSTFANESLAMTRETGHMEWHGRFRYLWVVMLALLQFYAFGSDFIPERLTMSVVEMVEPEAMECVLDYDADAASRKARQESPDIRAWVTDVIPALLPVADGRAPMLFRLPAWRDASLACIPFYDTPLFVRVCSYLI